MKSLLLSLVAGFFIAASAPPATNVYICNGKYSTKYHLSEDCSGLSNCSTKIEKVSLKEAQDKGRTLCKSED